MTRRARARQARVRARRTREAASIGADDIDPAERIEAHRSRDRGRGAGEPAARDAGPAPGPTSPGPIWPGPASPGLVEAVHGEPFAVRPVTGAAASKTYACPGCLHPIAPRVPHLVVWPLLRGLDGAPGLQARRHWHRHCWRSLSGRQVR